MTLQGIRFPALFFLLRSRWGLALGQGEERVWNDLAENTAPRPTHSEESSGTLENAHGSAEKPPFPEAWGFVFMFFNQCTKSCSRPRSGHVVAGSWESSEPRLCSNIWDRVFLT